LQISYQTKRKLLAAFERLGADSYADRLRLCGSKFTAVTCGRHIVERRAHHRCDLRLCPFCAPRRSRKIVAKYLPKARAFVRHASTPVTPCHVVLTLKHRRGESLVLMRKRLLEAFKRLTKRKLWSEHFAGGLYAVEATIGKDGCWHCHLHVLAFRKRFFAADQLKADWLAVTGDSHNLRIDRVKDLQSGLGEVMKYISKPMDINVFTTDHVGQFLNLKGARMFSAFGEFAEFCKTYQPSDNEDQGEAGRVDYCEGDACPVCADPLFEVAMSVEDLIGFARRLEVVPKLGCGGVT
jgi:hypothetical protein